MRRRAAAAVLAVVPLVNGGCGRERIDPPDTVRPATPTAAEQQGFPRVGLFVERPGNWPLVPGRAPLVASTSSGTATVALWRYLRSEPLPREDAALEDAQRALEEAVRARDPSFVLEEGRRIEVDGAPAVQLLGTETVAGQKRRVRSTHVYAKESEVVLDAYAPEAEFERVDREVFTPMVESLKIDPPAG